MVDGNEMES